MSKQQAARAGTKNLETRLAAYLAASGGAAAILSSEAEGAIVANTTIRPILINSEIDIDFNNEGHAEFQIDHDRFTGLPTTIDYLQIDKHNANSETNPFPDGGANVPFPFPEGVIASEDHAYLMSGIQSGLDEYYPSALTAGTLIGPEPPENQSWGFGESVNQSAITGQTVRANRLLDEDNGQIDATNPATTAITPVLGTPGWEGTGGQIRYLGLRVDLNNSAGDGPERSYGWVGVRITNEADATGEVVGYAYETELDTPIAAGDIGPVTASADYDDDGDVDGADFMVWQTTLGAPRIPFTGADGSGNGIVDQADLTFWQSKYATATATSNPGAAAVPEPASLAMGGISGLLMLGAFVVRRFFR